MIIWLRVTFLLLLVEKRQVEMAEVWQEILDCEEYLI